MGICADFKSIFRVTVAAQCQLLDEVAEFDLKTQFEIRAQRGAGKTQRGLELLEKAKFTQ